MIFVTQALTQTRRFFFPLLFCLWLSGTALAQQPGADGLGDRLYPLLGNGGYDVQHYTIDLDFDPANNYIDASATIDAIATQDLAAFNLDFVGLTINGIRVNDEPASHSRAGQELSVRPAVPLIEGETFSATIEYSGSPQPIDDPAVPFSLLGWQEYTDGYFAAVSQPSGSMNWFPCNNHPLDKATYTMRITVPEALTAAANGRLIEISEPTNESRTFHWEMDDPMASYLAIVAVGDFVSTRDESGPVPIRNYFPADAESGFIANFDITQEMMTWLIALLGPYPFDEYGVVIVPGFPAALETQSLSIFGEGMPPEELELVIMHELLHQWFGNSVTNAQMSDIWIHEGVATYFMALWLEYWYGPPAFEDMIATFATTGDEPNYAPGDLPVHALFSSSSYFRGALVLHALRLEVGDATFVDILRAFYQENVYGVSTNGAFIATAERVSGRDLGALFDAWLYGEEMPSLP